MWHDTRDKLAHLARLDVAPDLCARSHRYALSPVATARDIEAVEARHGIRLPEDYRDYVAAVGSGGAGPFYGLFRFGHYRDRGTDHRWDEGPFATVPSRSFALTEAWNLPPGYLAGRDAGEPSPAAERDAVEALARAGVRLDPPTGRVVGKNPFTGAPTHETWDFLITRAAYGSALMDGTVAIATQGGNLGVSLVVSGPERGNVWLDLRADSEGIVPASAPGRRRLTFFEWYQGWLDGELARRGEER